jgi:hypothetical protein
VAFLKKRVAAITNLRLPREFDNNPESPLWGKLLLLHHSALGVPMNGILKNRVVTIKKVFWHCCWGSRRLLTFMSFYFTLDFAIVFLTVLVFYVIMEKGSKAKWFIFLKTTYLISQFLILRILNKMRGNL